VRTKVIVVGATGFIGRALWPELVRAGYPVRACSRHPPEDASPGGVEWIRCDLSRPESLGPALRGMDAAYYLVHGLGSADFRARDRRAAELFRDAAAAAGLERIIYLGGVAPRGGLVSEHLASRLEVGEILRGGAVPTLELRASMIIGPGSASWRIVRDLALRLPVMVLPAWLRSRTRPLALDDAVRALVDGLGVELPASRWLDIPGPETLSGREILMRIAALRGRRIPALGLRWLSPGLSSLWLRLVTRADYRLARELVYGLTGDLLPESERYWEMTGNPPRISFDEAVRATLAAEPPGGGSGAAGRLEESLVDRAGRLLLPARAR
jgi:uncharacterized protein YbjT (DUF2867 family)